MKSIFVKRIFAILSIVLFCLCGCTDKQEVSTLTEGELNRPVRKTEKSKKEEKEFYALSALYQGYSEDNITSSSYFEYDDDGYLVKITTKIPDQVDREILLHNDKNNRTTEVTYHSMDGIYVYDERGNVIKYTSQNYTGNRSSKKDKWTYIYTYDEHDNCLSQKMYANKELCQDVIMTYDEHNNRISSTGLLYDAREELAVNMNIENVYNEQGTLIKSIVRENGDRETTYIYDEHNYITQVSSVDKDGKISKITIEYEYDDHGNIIKSKCYNPDNSMKIVKAEYKKVKHMPKEIPLDYRQIFSKNLLDFRILVFGIII